MWFPGKSAVEGDPEKFGCVRIWNGGSANGDRWGIECEGLKDGFMSGEKSPG